MRATTRIRRSKIGALLAVPALILMLSACASEGTAAETPAVSEDAPLSDAEFAAARDAYDMKVAQCLRDKGFDVKDPKPGEGIVEDLPGINEAGSACYEELGDPPTAGKQLTDAEQMDSMMRTVECLREKGYDVPDPSVETGIRGTETVPESDLTICYS
ncbi:MAG: hypothetical protein ABWY30_08975 [Microterricola sp.]